jgi:hypothetical protein
MASGEPVTDLIDDPSPRLVESARGWHTIQLAALGFIGICGVLHTAGPTTPGSVQVIAAILAVASLVIACWAVFVVGRVAWPTTVVPPAVAGARLRAGVRLTVLALVLAVVATLSGWWPKPTDTAAVSVTDSAGRTWCGPLTSAPPGTVGVHTAQQVVNVPLQTVAQIRAVSGCP